MYIDADDFCQPNHKFQTLMFIKSRVPDFKINLFTIPGLCSKEFIEEIKKLDWIDMIPHGWTHDTPLECLNWTYEESIKYLDKIEQLGLTKGFKAPGWQISDGMYQALLERDYWVADQPYNNDRRPKELKTYLLNEPDRKHYHIGHMGGYNDNEISDFMNEIVKFNGEFKFIKDLWIQSSRQPVKTKKKRR